MGRQLSNLETRVKLSGASLPRRSPWAEAGGVGLLLFLAAALPFARQLLLGAGLLDDDVFLQSLPAWEWLSRNLRSGESILWAPEMMGGFPIAFTQYPFLYPPDLLLAWLLPPFQAYAWSLVLHLLLAGLLTYSYCRTIGLGAWAALLAALSYQMSSEVVAGSSGFTARSAFALPGVMLASELVLRRGPRYGPLVALLIAAALLGGHPQLVLFALATGALHAGFRLLQVARSSGVRRAGEMAGWLALAAAVGVAGAAARLIPTWEVVALSTRSGGLPAEMGSGGALSVQGLLVGYLLPLTRLQTLPWGAPPYAGPAVVVLAVLGLGSLAARPIGGFLLGLGTLAALLALGEATPLHQIGRLPLLSFFREPSRYALVATFCLAVLGGMALEGFLERVHGIGMRRPRGLVPLAALSGVAVAALFSVGALFQFGAGPVAESLRAWSQSHFVDSLNPLRPRMALALLGVPAVLLALALAAGGRLSGRGLAASLVATSMAVLVPLAAILNPAIEPEVLAGTPETVRFLEGQEGSFRVFGHRPGMRIYNHMHFYGPSPEEGFGDDLRYRFQAEMLAPVLNLRWGILSADGYEQLHSLHQETMLRYVDSERISDWARVEGRWAHLTMEHRVRVLRMLGVRYLLSGADLSLEAPGLKEVARVEVDPGPTSRAAPEVRVLEVPNPLPRYHLVFESRYFGTDGEALDAVAFGEVDPAEVVLLPRGEGGVAGTTLAPNGQPAVQGKGAVEIVALGNDRVSLRVSADRPAYLVTSDGFWPGWRAWVDGREVPVLRANVSGRAVWLGEAGEHEVTFAFEPPGFAFGVVASSIAAVCWLAWALLAARAGGRSAGRVGLRAPHGR